MFRKAIYFLIYDIFIVTACFLFWIWLKPASLRIYLPNYFTPFLIFMGIWLLASVAFQKYRGLRKKNLKTLGWDLISANVVALSVSAIVIYGFRVDFFSRQIVFGTVAFSSIIELVAAFIYYNVIHATEEPTDFASTTKIEEYLTAKPNSGLSKQYEPVGTREERIKENLIETCGLEVYDILTQNVNPFYDKSLVLSTITQFNVDKQLDEYFENIINIKHVNNIRHINNFLKAINYKLPIGGLFIGCGETKDIRKRRILEKYPLLLNYFVYTLDFFFSRLLPKFQFTKPIYYFITKGQDRVFSKAEILGRLYYAGFELVRDITTKDMFFFVVHKISTPFKRPPSKYGLFIKLRRVGKHKKMINVYKLRTMHPYSEYIQDLVYTRHGTVDGDKATNDYRITTLGKIFRRLWLDELPMLLNLIKRQIKLVGVRPLSQAKFNMYPKPMQEKRTRCKPGLIPPFYVDMPNSFEELVASEEKYLDQYFKQPLWTDFKYFWLAGYNILIKRARSK